MPPSTDCKQNRDPLKLVREGTSQGERLARALDPAYAPVDDRTVAHGMVFAQAYSAFLNYFSAANVLAGDWKPFFSRDVSVLLAMASVQDVEFYKARVKEFLDFLKDLGFQSDETKARAYLGYLFSSAGTLARQLDILKEGLPADIALKPALQNLIQSQLAPALKRLIAYYKADLATLPESDRLIADLQPGLVILGSITAPFSNIYQSGLSGDWITDSSADWAAYTNAIDADSSVYGSGIEAFQRINHIATHNLFTSVLDQFLKVYARTASDGSRALEASFKERDNHEPHYALFLAFLRLFEYARAEANTLTGRHLDFYYREVLRLKEKEARPGQAHLLVELAKHVSDHLLKTGELFRVEEDDLGGRYNKIPWTRRITMSMLYLWHPAVSEAGTEMDLILTRGDSDQIGGGADRFINAILHSLDVSTPAQKWSIKPHRCNFYGEYWMEDGWQNQWDFVWRMSIHFKAPVKVEPLKLGYVGIDEIDDYSPLVESYKYEPFACLVVGVFPSGKKAQAAAGKVIADNEIVAARRAAAAPEPVLQVLRVAAQEFHLRAAIGTGDAAFFKGDYPAMVASLLEASGGITHAEG